MKKYYIGVSIKSPFQYVNLANFLLLVLSRVSPLMLVASMLEKNLFFSHKLWFFTQMISNLPQKVSLYLDAFFSCLYFHDKTKISSACFLL